MYSRILLPHSPSGKCAVTQREVEEVLTVRPVAERVRGRGLRYKGIAIRCILTIIDNYCYCVTGRGCCGGQCRGVTDEPELKWIIFSN